MAEGVYSNFRMKARAKFRCECGQQVKLKIKVAPGRGSQKIVPYQCEACRKVIALTVFGDGEIKGDGITANKRNAVVPTMPPETGFTR